jgi:squalene-hopene/tetraprenyl-beta-curcumene cyclase
MPPAGHVDRTIAGLTARLLERRQPSGAWEGALASSALSTATAVVALALAGRAGAAAHEALVAGGTEWLARTQNADGGWGDTTRSRSNLSTTLLARSALSVGRPSPASAAALDRVDSFLRAEIGQITPERLRRAIVQRYGKDYTFSVPILAVLAMTGGLGEGRAAWRLVPQLPFELAACPHQWFEWLRLPVVSYALPALVAMGQVRHHHAPSRNPLLRLLRDGLARSTRDALAPMQPQSGGYLEATPLTSFVVMSLVSAGHGRHPVVPDGVAFLTASVRDDGSWPIDTNLATWVTTLAVAALGSHSVPPEAERGRLVEWLLNQQHLVQHPFTHAAPGGWAWTDLSGGVPDADDTAGALVALSHLARDEPRARDAAVKGVRWLFGLQNRDGGIPTFCRGWGALPFDRSAPDLTAHALQAWLLWRDALPRALQARVTRAVARAVAYLVAGQRADGQWLPLWFGNEHASGEQNPVYGTSRVLLAVADLPAAWPHVDQARQRAVQWLLSVQNGDGGWGGDRGAPSSIEETGVALQALARCARRAAAPAIAASAERAVEWLVAATGQGQSAAAAPIGLYFARLWYFEELYPIVFALAGLREWRRVSPTLRP